VCVKKPLSERWHEYACGIGPIQRDLYSAFLDVSDPDHLYSSCAQYQGSWEGVEARLRAAYEVVLQRANEGQVLPGSMGVPRARVRQLESLSDHPLEPAVVPALVWRRDRLEAGSALVRTPRH
jgi:hypothetical protein